MSQLTLRNMESAEVHEGPLGHDAHRVGDPPLPASCQRRQSLKGKILEGWKANHYAGYNTGASKLYYTFITLIRRAVLSGQWHYNRLH